MKGIIIIVGFVFSITSNLYSQDSLNYKSILHLNLSAGRNFTTSKLLDGRITDNLFKYSDNSSYLQASASYFPFKHWGIDFTYSAIASNRTSNRAEAFLTGMVSEYSDSYYVTPSTGASFNNTKLFGSTFERTLLGVVFRYEVKRLFFYPKVSIGLTSFSTDWGEAVLKQKNSNNIIKVNYSPEKTPHDQFTMATSVALGYKLSKRFYLNLDIMSSFFKTEATFAKKITDLNVGTTTSEIIEYSKGMQTISIGTGLIYVIK